MSFGDDDSFHNVLSFVLFTISAALVAVLVWVLLRRLRRQRHMCDQETMTVEPNVKPASVAEAVSGTGASIRESVPQIPGLDEATKRDRKPSERLQPTSSGAANATAAAETTKSSPPGGPEPVAEAKAESKKQATAGGAGLPGDSSEASVLTNKSKKRRLSVSKMAPEGSSGAADKEDGKGRRSSAASKTGSKAGSKAGSKPSSRRGSVQQSQASASKAGTVAARESSSSEVHVPALLIRRPSTDSRSSLRSNRSTRYVRETPKVPPPMDVFSREHSSMVESPPSAQSPPQAAVTEATKSAKPPEAHCASSSKIDVSEKPQTEAATNGRQ
ncbi:hypothetical protein HPB50_017406 [Hyalomma asiaticum]|uniref:Uncharacterized protein n=1 Tax=Hyalomma asiaticum TaxID=266040 RepID=A0ACB7T1S1_HYAAI|nr:hypothetical protein HPB50_017406 [Hyalomma asiaticum]